MRLLPLRPDLRSYLKAHQLTEKWDKAKALFENDIRHPSLHLELLEPHWHGIYSFRLDRKYRATFFIKHPDVAEVFAITNHYKK